MKMPPINSSDYVAKNLWPWYRASYSNNRTLLISCKWDVPLRDYSHHRWVLALASNCCQVPPNKHHPFLWCLRNKKKATSTNISDSWKIWWLARAKNAAQNKRNYPMVGAKTSLEVLPNLLLFHVWQTARLGNSEKKTLPIFLVTFSW